MENIEIEILKILKLIDDFIFENSNRFEIWARESWFKKLNKLKNKFKELF